MTDPGNGRAVSRDLWLEAHRALADRVTAIERRHDREDEDARIRAAAAVAERRARAWQFAIGVALVLLPTVLAALVAYLGSR